MRIPLWAALIGAAILVGIAAAALFGVSKGGSEPPTTTSESFQDWVVSCAQGPDKKRHCSMSQTVVDVPRHIKLLAISVGPQSETTNTLILRIEVPLGVWLDPGVGLRITPDAKVTTLSFARCMPSGCLADGVITDTLLTQLNSVTEASLLVADRNKQISAIPFSLKGFQPALAQLKKNLETRPRWLSWLPQK